MLFVWVWRILGIFVVLTAIYIALSIFKRWEERRRLGADYDSRQAAGEVDEPRALYVQRGMDAYNRSLRRKLLLGVYLIPLITVAVLVALAQLG